MSTAELLFVFLALPILCGLAFATPFLLILGKFLDWQDLADRGTNRLQLAPLSARFLLRPAQVVEDPDILVRSASSPPSDCIASLLKPSNSDDADN